MNDNKRSFWSTTAGVVTGVASVLTALVGLLTVSINLGWLGSKDDGSKRAATTGETTSSPSTTAFAATTTTPTGRTSSAAATSLTPLAGTPAQLTFDSLGGRDEQVTIRNNSAVSLTLRRPTIAGVDASQFTATDLTCGTRLDANRTCEVKVTFLATKAGTSSATLVLQPEGPPALEVQLRGSRLI